MAIYIQINKLEDLGDAVVYEFGPSEGIVGKVAIEKLSGEVVFVEIDASHRQEFYLPRVQRALSRHFQRGEFPERTCYAA